MENDSLLNRAITNYNSVCRSSNSDRAAISFAASNVRFSLFDAVYFYVLVKEGQGKGDSGFFCNNQASF